jgi:hypothetical protein
MTPKTRAKPVAAASVTAEEQPYGVHIDDRDRPARPQRSPQPTKQRSVGRAAEEMTHVAQQRQS